MEAKFTLPPEITEGATVRGNEYGWTLKAFPEALLNAQALGYACLGGQFQFRLDDGTYEMYWINADSTDRREGKSWAEYCRRSCGEVLDRFKAAVANADFVKEASSWPSLATAMANGWTIANHLVFVAYFVTEAELAAR
jgi:hypothetical protein